MKNPKPTPEQMIAVLNSLTSCMSASVIMLKMYGREDKAKELDGALYMVNEWITSLSEEYKTKTKK
jgi:hypothetical protein